MSKILQKLSPYILIAGGVLFLVLGIKCLLDRQTFLNTTGTITDIQIDYNASADGNKYYVYVRYTVEGEEYESELGEYSSSMHVGDTVNILYNPENLNEITTASPFGLIMQLGMGVLCLVCAVMYFKKKEESA